MSILSADSASTQAWERRERESRDLTCRIAGQSAAITAIRKTVAAVASNHSTVLIVGESGVGKELIARTIHDMSSRSQEAFVAVNCGALPESLLESQLFGHVKGAFTGASQNTLGIFRSAEGGTVFLDEITDMSPGLQVKLLRVLQEREVVPVGDSQPVPVDARIIAASKERLGHSGNGLLRKDLFYRLSVVQVEVPALRDRREDIPLLVDHFNAKHAMAYGQVEMAVPPTVIKKLVGYDWPGNIRELSNIVERWYALGCAPDFESSFRSHDTLRENDEEGRTGTSSGNGIPTWDQAERALIVRALNATDGSKVRAAELLQIERHRLYRKIRKYRIPANK